MSWGSWQNFWAMGGYASYVWGAYGVTLLAIILELWFVKARQRRALADLARLRRQPQKVFDESTA
jgi:heme exporter protein D